MEDTRNSQVALAEAMGRLIESQDFKLVFQDTYIDAFAITNLYNLHMYDADGRRRFLEKSMARSVFSAFVDDIIQSGNDAKESLNEEVEIID